MKIENRKYHIQELDKENPMWQIKFMNTLDSLLNNADVSCILTLRYHPEGILKEAAEQANIPGTLFPMGKLSMRFDHGGHIIVGDEEINAEEFLQSAMQEMAATCKR